jgi:hypothetical protein
VNSKQRLWDSVHPYYATHGCYYVSGTLGHGDHVRGYDGRTCHSRYATWQSFKDADELPFTDEQLEMRRRYGVKEATTEERQRQVEAFGKSTVHSMDMDLNLLYRWDWTDGTGDDDKNVDANGIAVGDARLDLFFMCQRKARPYSVTIESVSRDDEPEIRAWLWTRWCHLMRLWSPVSGWPVEPAECDGAHQKSEALEHVACAMAEAAVIA